MKVIFLDVDGVLNSDDYLKKVKKLNYTGIQREVDVEKIKLLKKAIEETGAKTVLISSWRYTQNAQNLKELLANFDIFVDVTPYIQNKRGLEIKQWLSEHQDIEDFVILDDEIFSSYDEELINKLIKISNADGFGFGDGLVPSDVEEIIRRLGKKRIKQLTDEDLEI